MVRKLCIDLKKMFGNYHIYLCMMSLGFVYIVVYFQTLSSGIYQFGIVSSYDNIAEGSMVMLVSFLLSIVGGSVFYCAEEKYGYLLFEIQRVGTSVYTISKVLISLIGGFCTVMVGNIIYLCGILLHRLWIFESISLVGENIEHMMWLWLFSALRCGVLSAIGFLISTYISNYYIAVTVPLLIYYVILELEYWISLYFPMIPEKFFFTDTYLAGYIEGNDLQEFMFALLYTACVSVIIYRMAKSRIERRLEHV